MSTDRKTLRRMVLRRFGDFTLLTATSAGTTTTLIDATRLTGLQPGAFVGRDAHLSGGTASNLGQSRRITAFNPTTGTITFNAALPAATQSGDECEVSNAYSMGVTADDANDAINYAISVSRPYALVPAVEDIATAFDSDGSRTVALDADWAGVLSVHYQPESTSHYQPVKRAPRLGGHGWSVDRANRTILINGYPARSLDERSLRVYGYTRPAALTADSDTTDVDLEWLIATATAHLLLDVAKSRSGADWQSRGLYEEDKANRIRSRLTPRLGPSYTAI